ncbi:MAG TPA: hypothetical protein VLE97_10050 [Gaiellaceae bacterium]|nr:hypothetical protein [Gaiellaceae bacterium]
MLAIALVIAAKILRSDHLVLRAVGTMAIFAIATALEIIPKKQGPS